MKKILILTLALVLCSFSLVGAEDFPQRDLQGIIMWGAGGATDNVARAITPLVEPILGQQIVLVNKPGGTGAISTQYVYSQAADGYTLLYGAENPQVHKVLELSKIDYQEFYPVNILAYGVGVIVANKDMPWDSLKDLIEDAKKRPGEIKMGSTGPGGLPHVIGTLLKTVVPEFEYNPIPFDGEGPGITALQGGHVDFMPAGLTAVREQIRAGRVKPLAIVSAEPIAGVEDIPLIIEDYPEFDKYLPWGPYYGIFVKKGTPEPAKKVLVDAFEQAAATDKFKNFINDFGAVLLNISGGEARKFLDKNQSITCWLLHQAGGTKVSPEKFNIPKP